VGLDTDEYRVLDAVDAGWTGMAELGLDDAQLSELYDSGEVYAEAAAELPAHTGLVLLSSRGSALGRVTPDKQVRLVRGDREAFGLHGRSAEQRIALDLLLDPEIGIVSLGGRAGTGKSALALCAGLESVLERRAHKKVVIFRPLYAVGGQELGYLPGSEGEKMSPWAQAVYDTLGALVSSNVLEEIAARELIEVLPLYARLAGAEQQDAAGDQHDHQPVGAALAVAEVADPGGHPLHHLDLGALPLPVLRQQRGGVDAEPVGVGAQEPLGVDVAAELLEPFRFEGFEVARPDVGGCGCLLERLPLRRPGRAQRLTDGAQREHPSRARAGRPAGRIRASRNVVWCDSSDRPKRPATTLAPGYDALAVPGFPTRPRSLRSRPHGP
jgi:hypothetical protein